MRFAMATRSNAPTDLDQLVSKRIRMIRMQRGMTLKDVASELGIVFQQLHKYEAGLLRVSAGMLASLARIFNCDVADLFPPELKVDQSLDPDVRIDLLKQDVVNLVLESGSETTLLALKTLLENAARSEVEPVPEPTA